MSEKIKKLPDMLPTGKKDLEIAKFHPNDAEEMHRVITDNKTHLDKGGLYLTQLYSSPEKIVERSDDDAVQLYAIRKDGEIVGGAQLWDNNNALEIYRWVDKENTRQGIATAALSGMMCAADTAGVSLRSVILRNNTGSKTTVERAGFREVGGDYREVVYERPPHDTSEK